MYLIQLPLCQHELDTAPIGIPSESATRICAMSRSFSAVDASDVEPNVKSEATAVPQEKSRFISAGAWREHQDLIRNAGSLVGTTGVTSILGAAYWTIAARLFSQQEVGYGAAEIPAMTLLGTIGMFGLGTLLIGELPRRKRPSGLVSAALIASALGSLLLGVCFVFIAPYFSGRFEDIIGTSQQGAIFALGVMLTGAAFVLDLATIGLLRGGIQLTRNIVFCAVKLIALPLAASILHNQLGVGIMLSWVGGLLLSVLAVVIPLRNSGISLFARPDWQLLRSLGRSAMAHNWLNIAMMVPPTLIPVLVTIVVSPSANAAFYIAYMLSGFLYVIPTHLGTTLFAVAAADPKAMARKMRFALRICYLIGLPSTAILILVSHTALSIYGPGYARIATVPMWLLALGYIPSVPRLLYIAVCRSSGRIVFAATVLTAFTVTEIASVTVAGATDGLLGVSAALLAVFVAEGLVTTPAVLRAAFASGRHRRASGQADGTPAEAMSQGIAPASAFAGNGYVKFEVDPITIALETENWNDQNGRDRQLAGIAALQAIAWSAASTAPLPIIPVLPIRPARVSAPEHLSHYAQAPARTTDPGVRT